MEKVAECSRKQKTGSRRWQKTEKCRRYKTDGGSVLMQAVALLWICMNLPRIGIL